MLVISLVIQVDITKKKKKKRLQTKAVNQMEYPPILVHVVYIDRQDYSNTRLSHLSIVPEFVPQTLEENDLELDLFNIVQIRH